MFALLLWFLYKMINEVNLPEVFFLKQYFRGRVVKMLLIRPDEYFILFHIFKHPLLGIHTFVYKIFKLTLPYIFNITAQNSSMSTQKIHNCALEHPISMAVFIARLLCFCFWYIWRVCLTITHIPVGLWIFYVNISL